MTWINEELAFPDKECECLKDKYSMIPVRCFTCGADRTASNWVDEQKEVNT